MSRDNLPRVDSAIDGQVGLPADAEPTLEDDVERAFRLLGHYQELVRDRPGCERDADEERAAERLESVIRRWLPPALRSEDSTLTRAHAILGDREAARRLLAGLDLREQELACLKLKFQRPPRNPGEVRDFVPATCGGQAGLDGVRA